MPQRVNSKSRWRGHGHRRCLRPRGTAWYRREFAPLQRREIAVRVDGKTSVINNTMVYNINKLVTQQKTLKPKVMSDFIFIFHK